MNNIQYNTKECYKSILNETINLIQLSNVVNSNTIIKNKEPMLLELNNLILDNLNKLHYAQIQYNNYNNLIENFIITNNLSDKDFSDWKNINPKLDNIANQYKQIYINIIKSLTK